MTWKQERFCEEFIVDANARAAAIRAGYSAKSESNPQRLMANKEVRARICELMGSIQSERVARAAEVVGFLTAVMRDEVEGMKTTSKDRIRAAELLGKRYGVFGEKDCGGDQEVIVISGEQQLE